MTIPKNITQEHILQAIQKIDSEGVPFHRQSVQFNLLYNDQYYPPKYIVSLANIFANGHELPPEQFNGGAETNTFLEKLGFSIVRNETPAEEEGIKMINKPTNQNFVIKEASSWTKLNNINMIGRKKVDWSIFREGTTIPNEFHQDFEKANHGRHLELGEKESVVLIINDQNYDAVLSNVNRKINGDTLQLKYGKSVSDLFQSQFQLSLKYIEEQRKLNPNKAIVVPDDEAEYIDFYQTEKPFVYKVILHKKSTLSNHAYWWVNQGKTHQQEKDGGYLWAPETNKIGNPVSHHVNLLNAKVGDMVFCYSSLELKAIGIVKKEAIKAQKPSEISSSEWQSNGYLLTLDYFNFDPFIRKDEIPEAWRKEEEGPFDINGNIKQGYFYELSKEFVKKLYNKFFERFPLEAKKIMGDYDFNNASNNDTEIVKETHKSFKSSVEMVNHIHNYIKSKGFYYKKEEVINLFLSLKTKPFVILSGISGTGKTKMVQWFAESLGATEENGQFHLIPIRPDWNDGSDLLGYKDIKGDFVEGPLTRIIKQANESLHLPYFVLLDEMNLARVEYYFSDILSVMESRKWQDGQIVTSHLLSKEMTGYDFDLRIPSNLYIVGTVNMDETTHPFSKKVLDRANTIEFNRVELSNISFLNETEDVAAIPVWNEKLASKYLHLKDVYHDHQELVIKTTDELEKINKSLQIMNAHVGYRVRDEICFYLAYNEEDKLMKENEAFDHCILQKILPRITGSDSRVEQLLMELYRLFTNKEFVD